MPEDDQTFSHSLLSSVATSCKYKVYSQNKPKRNLTAYNLFFREERQKIIEERRKECRRAGAELLAKENDSSIGDLCLVENAHNSVTTIQQNTCASLSKVDDHSLEQEEFQKYGDTILHKRKWNKAPHYQVSFEDLGKLIAERWKSISEKDLARYKNLAATDLARYRTDLKQFKLSQLQIDRVSNEVSTHDSAVTYQQKVAAVRAALGNDYSSTTRNVSHDSYSQSPGTKAERNFPLAFPGMRPSTPAAGVRCFADSSHEFGLGKDRTHKLDDTSQQDSEYVDSASSHVSGLMSWDDRRAHQSFVDHVDVQSITRAPAFFPTKPKRNLTAYNFFFRHERQKIIDMGFEKYNAIYENFKQQAKSGSEENEERQKQYASEKTAELHSATGDEAPDESQESRGKVRGSDYNSSSTSSKGKSYPRANADDFIIEDKNDSHSKFGKKYFNRLKGRPHYQVSFEMLGKIIAKRWKQMTDNDLAPFKKLAEQDLERFRVDMRKYHSDITSSQTMMIQETGTSSAKSDVEQATMSKTDAVEPLLRQNASAIRGLFTGTSTSAIHHRRQNAPSPHRHDTSHDEHAERHDVYQEKATNEPSHQSLLSQPVYQQQAPSLQASLPYDASRTETGNVGDLAPHSTLIIPYDPSRVNQWVIAPLQFQQNNNPWFSPTGQTTYFFRPPAQQQTVYFATSAQQDWTDQQMGTLPEGPIVWPTGVANSRLGVSRQAVDFSQLVECARQREARAEAFIPISSFVGIEDRTSYPFINWNRATTSNMHHFDFRLSAGLPYTTVAGQQQHMYIPPATQYGALLQPMDLHRMHADMNAILSRNVQNSQEGVSEGESLISPMFVPSNEQQDGLHQNERGS